MRIGIRELIFLLLLVAMPVAAYFFVFEPRAVANEVKRQEIAQKQQKLQELEAATRNIEDLGAEIDLLTEAIDVFEQKLPAKREVEVILKEVWELATKHNLTPRSVRTDKPVDTAHYGELPILMRIVGDFDGFYEFLREVERLSRITRMPQMRLRKIETEQGQMEAELTLSIFFESNATVASAGGR